MDIQVGYKLTYKSIEEPDEEARAYIIKDEYQLFDILGYIVNNEIEILKIERPKYEVVEEKNDLLTEEEKEFLKLYMKINNIKASKLIFNIFEINFIDGNISFTSYINTDYSFRKLLYNKEYTLKELGLEK